MEKRDSRKRGRKLDKGTVGRRDGGRKLVEEGEKRKGSKSGRGN